MLDHKLYYNTLHSACLLNLGSSHISSFKEGIRTKEFSWYHFLSICIKNKVVGLVYFNILQSELIKLLPDQINFSFRYIFQGTSQKTKELCQERDRLLKEFSKENLRVYPLKGAILAEHCYPDYGTRSMLDIDFYVSRQDSEAVHKIMIDSGYINGDYDEDSDLIVPFDSSNLAIRLRDKINLPTYARKSLHSRCMYIDFSKDISYTSKEGMSDLIISEGEFQFGTTTSLNCNGFFIHLCCHLYKEATNIEWAEIDQDINYIKFLDVYLFYQKFKEKMDFDVLKETSEKVGVFDQVLKVLEIVSTMFQEEVFKIKYSSSIESLLVPEGEEKSRYTLIEKMTTLLNYSK